MPDTLQRTACNRYVVSSGPSAIFVAFQGTQHLSDWAANLSVRHAPLWRRGSGDRARQKVRASVQLHRGRCVQGAVQRVQLHRGRCLQGMVGGVERSCTWVA